jgi:uncharacterized protein (TIGR00251 family)
MGIGEIDTSPNFFATDNTDYVDNQSMFMIRVKVKPNSRVSLLEQQADGTWLAQTKSPPVDGKANEELISLVAKHFKCHKSQVTIKAGASSRLKSVRIEGTYPSLSV